MCGDGRSRPLVLNVLGIPGEVEEVCGLPKGNRAEEESGLPGGNGAEEGSEINILIIRTL